MAFSLYYLFNLFGLRLQNEVSQGRDAVQDDQLGRLHDLDPQVGQ